MTLHEGKKVKLISSCPAWLREQDRYQENPWFLEIWEEHGETTA
jgi:hypothetical protein